MTSHKRRTSSRSGGSAKSKKTERSPPTANTSRTAPASFEQVFGALEPEKVRKLREQRNHAWTRLLALQADQTPTLALYRTRHLQRLRNLQRHIQQLDEAITTEIESIS